MPLLMNEEHTFLYTYENIPPTVTLSSYTTGMEQLRVSSDNLNKVMINSILPQVIEPKIPITELYEPDFFLLLRHLRILTWGPFYTTGAWYCQDCINDDGLKGKLVFKDKQINLAEIPVIRPDKDDELKTKITLTPDDFIFLDATVNMHLNKCKDILLYDIKLPKDRQDLVPIAASISHVSGLDFVDIREVVDWLYNLSPADSDIIKFAYKDAFNIGLSSKYNFTCPECGGRALCSVPVNDAYFRPSRSDLQAWKKLLRASKTNVQSNKQ